MLLLFFGVNTRRRGQTVLMPGKTGPVFTRKRWKDLQDQIEAEARDALAAENERRRLLREETLARQAAERARREAELAAMFSQIDTHSGAQLHRSALSAAQGSGAFQQQFGAARAMAVHAHAELARRRQEALRQKAEQEDEEKAIRLLMES